MTISLVHRRYFNPDRPDSSQKRPLHPVQYGPKDRRFSVRARFLKGELDEGFYNIIWAVSLNKLGSHLRVKELAFEIEAPFLTYKLWAKVSEDQISQIDRSGLVRLRLQQRLNLRYPSPVYLRMNGRLGTSKKEEADDSDASGSISSKDGNYFDIHYVELEHLGSAGSTDAKEFVVAAPGTKLKSLDIRSCQSTMESTGYDSTAQIFGIDISTEAPFVVVLSATASYAYLGLWDYSSSKEKTNFVRSVTPENREEAIRPIIMYSPLASLKVPLGEGHFENMRLLRVAISSDGTNIVVYQQPLEDDKLHQKASNDIDFGKGKEGDGPVEKSKQTSLDFHFRLYRREAAFSTAQDLLQDLASLSEITTLVEVPSTHPGLEDFVGYAKFLSRDRCMEDDRDLTRNGPTCYANDFFIACTSSLISVYDTSNPDDWSRLYAISIGALASMNYRVRQLWFLCRSIEGPYFVWWEDAQNVSIWDLETGTNIKYVSVNNPFSRGIQSRNDIERLSVSKGGFILALCGSDWIKTYFMDSGIEISRCILDESVARIGSRRILDIEFLDDDKSLLVMMTRSTGEQESVILDALNLSFHHARQFPTTTYSLQRTAKFIGIKNDAQSEGSTKVESDTDHIIVGVNGNELEMYAIPRPQKSDLKFPMMACPDSCVMKRGSLELNDHFYQAKDSNVAFRLLIDFEEQVVESRRQRYVRVILVQIDEYGSVEQLLSILPEPWRPLDIDEEDPEQYVQASFLPSWPQFIIVGTMGFQVWSLPNPSAPTSSLDSYCTLNLAWVFPIVESTPQHLNGIHSEQYLETNICQHGEVVTAVWYDPDMRMNQAAHIRIPRYAWFSGEETLHCINSIPMLISCYLEANAGAQDAIVRYIVKHINHDPPAVSTPDSVMSKIARTVRWKGCLEVARAIFNSSNGKWIPRCTSRGSSNNSRLTSTGQRIRNPRAFIPPNPLVILFRSARAEARSLAMAELIIDYCIREAKKERDPAYLMIVLDCLPHMVSYHPEIALDIMRRAAFIPVPDRNFIIKNAIVAHSPRLGRSWLTPWRRMASRRPIYLAPTSVFQLRSQLSKVPNNECFRDIEVAGKQETDPVNESFKRHIYVAPFALLWHKRGPEDGLLFRSNFGASKRIRRRMREIKRDPSSAQTLACLILDKLNPWSPQTIRANFSDLEYYDNPVLFEMRVLRSVCNIVTIILSIVVKIRVYFAIFAMGILAFSHAFVHVLHAKTHDCYSNDSPAVLSANSCPEREDTEFPRHFFGAIISTYFFMAGRYEPADKNLDSDDWAFSVMLAMYFFITVILLLNVLIALMNVAFSTGDDNGPLVWLDNRLRAVETAENISYSAVGLRKRIDWFPKYIYYTASPRQVQAFENKYPSGGRDSDSFQFDPNRHPHFDIGPVVTPTKLHFDQYSIAEPPPPLDPVTTSSETDSQSSDQVRKRRRRRRSSSRIFQRLLKFRPEKTGSDITDNSPSSDSNSSKSDSEEEDIHEDDVISENPFGLVADSIRSELTERLADDRRDITGSYVDILERVDGQEVIRDSQTSLQDHRMATPANSSQSIAHIEEEPLFEEPLPMSTIPVDPSNTSYFAEAHSLSEELARADGLRGRAGARRLNFIRQQHHGLTREGTKDWQGTEEGSLGGGGGAGWSKHVEGVEVGEQQGARGGRLHTEQHRQRNYEERQRQIQQELRAVHGHTTELGEYVQGLESKMDQMRLMLELLVQQQNEQLRLTE
ncbi:hypothetical protein BGW38_006251 [Lunasporangiospora selenospora]|uniref:Ion transport domain-containing protein n=1 Tax=Lunasporangiospora selenospora TaxID=979761 RepID=A0A9P6G1C0_9FUNG|nr:hypothetical protein BGW38_006251 [Lunasporangiospora selenospora]